MSILEVKKLKKYYGLKKGIEDVSIKLNYGEIYGFIGNIFYTFILVIQGVLFIHLIMLY